MKTVTNLLVFLFLTTSLDLNDSAIFQNGRVYSRVLALIEPRRSMRLLSDLADGIFRP